MIGLDARLSRLTLSFPAQSGALRLLFGWLLPAEFDETVVELDARVTPVAEWLVDGHPAAAKGHLVSYFVRDTI